MSGRAVVEKHDGTYATVVYVHDVTNPITGVVPTPSTGLSEKMLADAVFTPAQIAGLDAGTMMITRARVRYNETDRLGKMERDDEGNLTDVPLRHKATAGINAGQIVKAPMSEDDFMSYLQNIRLPVAEVNANAALNGSVFSAVVGRTVDIAGRV